ncbi:hypothetical protein ANN_13229 [Periplaneta americana]|uniref:Uncharacterized protein n=1 Tax=Periplaneta americana TaxID=6978 RepID=A0ABQ8TIU1_PERAM|nr:hypothetical protein ANN_13229 [Periplaneta americana]
MALGWLTQPLIEKEYHGNFLGVLLDQGQWSPAARSRGATAPAFVIPHRDSSHYARGSTRLGRVIRNYWCGYYLVFAEFFCARSKGRIPRHTSLNDIIKRSLTSCGIPSLLEPPGISRADGKRPDGLTLIPWSRRKSLIWDSTCVDTLAQSHFPNTSRRAASAAELAVKKKVNKYAHLLDNYIFIPFAVETIGPWSHDAKVLVSQIGQILISITGDRRCTTYLCQRLSIAIQRGNAMSNLGSLSESSPLDEFFLL